MGGRVSYESVYTLAEAQAVPDHKPENTYHPGGDKAFDHGRDYIFPVYHAPVKERKNRGH